jgi:hypothetical protein
MRLQTQDPKEKRSDPFYFSDPFRPYYWSFEVSRCGSSIHSRISSFGGGSGMLGSIGSGGVDTGTVAGSSVRVCELMDWIVIHLGIYDLYF